MDVKIFYFLFFNHRNSLHAVTRIAFVHNIILFSHSAYILMLSAHAMGQFWLTASITLDPLYSIWKITPVLHSLSGRRYLHTTQMRLLLEKKFGSKKIIEVPTKYLWFRCSKPQCGLIKPWYFSNLRFFLIVNRNGILKGQGAESLQHLQHRIINENVNVANNYTTYSRKHGVNVKEKKKYKLVFSDWKSYWFCFFISW